MAATILPMVHPMAKLLDFLKGIVLAFTIAAIMALALSLGAGLNHFF